MVTNNDLNVVTNYYLSGMTIRQGLPQTLSSNYLLRYYLDKKILTYNYQSILSSIELFILIIDDNYCRILSLVVQFQSFHKSQYHKNIFIITAQNIVY